MLNNMNITTFADGPSHIPLALLLSPLSLCFCSRFCHFLLPVPACNLLCSIWLGLAAAGFCSSEKDRKGGLKTFALAGIHSVLHGLQSVPPIFPTPFSSYLPNGMACGVAGMCVDSTYLTILHPPSLSSPTLLVVDRPA